MRREFSKIAREILSHCCGCLANFVTGNCAVKQAYVYTFLLHDCQVQLDYNDLAYHLPSRTTNKDNSMCCRCRCVKGAGGHSDEKFGRINNFQLESTNPKVHMLSDADQLTQVACT